MLLPRGKQEIGQPEVGPGFYPPMMRQLSPEEPEQWGVDPSYSMAHNAEAIAKVKGVGRIKKYNQMGQIIPIYGFGILLYILYIIYKLTCKGKTTKSEQYSTRTKQNVENNIPTDYELATLQRKVQETERVMERIVSGKGRVPGSGRRRKSKTAVSKQEEKLLRQLSQISQVMQEGRLEGASPEMEAEEVPYTADWEGYPEETYPEYDEPYISRGYDIIVLEEPSTQLPTAEALAERMEQEEEEEVERKLEVVHEEDEEEEEEEREEVEEEEEEAAKRPLLSSPPSPPAKERRGERVGLEVSKELQIQNGGKKQITFSEHKDVFLYPKEGTYEEEEVGFVDEEEEEEEEEDEGEAEVEKGEEEEEVTEAEVEEEVDEEDPVMEAESLTFSGDVCLNPEEEAEEEKEEYMLMSIPVERDGFTQSDMTTDLGISGLRMRNRRET